MDDLLTIAETAKRLGISTGSVRRLIDRGVLLPFRPTERRVVLSAAAIEEYLHSTRDVPREKKESKPVTRRAMKYL